ncbi:hypothetical protein KY285_009042 [Solanum tuberosum]|nr:hypothetical protein KY285_009042 [Solanum tuberosum]
MDLPSNFDARKEPHQCSLIHGDTGQDFQDSSMMQHGINAWQELYQCSSVRGGNNENMDVKYEEIGAPQVEEFCYITDNTYFKEEVLQIESSVLHYLKFEMTAPTAKWRSVAFQDFEKDEVQGNVTF